MSVIRIGQATFHPLEFRTMARKYARWYKGQRDRLTGLPCASANGLYLDGWYSPERDYPPFLLPEWAAELRKRFPNLFN